MVLNSFKINNGLSLSRVDYTPNAEPRLTAQFKKNLDLAVKRLELKYGVKQHFVKEHVYHKNS